MASDSDALQLTTTPCDKRVNTLNDGIVAAVDEGANVVGGCGCGSRNRYQLFGLERLALAGQMQARVRRSHVLVSVAGCAVVDGNQAAQELA